MKTLLITLALILSVGGIGFANEKNPYSSPEKTLGLYFESVKKGDAEAVKRCFVGSKYRLNESFSVESFKILERVVYSEEKATEVNKSGVVPRSLVGDVELVVRQVMREKAFTFSYNFREIEGEWKIISYTAWRMD